MHNFIKIVLFATLFFLLPGRAFAGWSEWHVADTFIGNTNDIGTWANVTYSAGWNDAFWMRNTTAFGNPAPEKWAKGFGFSIPEMIGKNISEVEVRVRYRRLYATSPTTNIELYVLKTNDNLTTALNASTTKMSQLVTNTAFTTTTFFWRDTGTNPWVSDYFPFYDPNQLWVVLTAQLNSSSGSSNFLDVSGLDIRFLTTDTNASETIPQNPTQLQVSIENLQDTLKSRAPFAYFYAVTEIDFSNISESDITFDFPVPYPTGTVHYYITISNELKDILAVVRTVTGIAIIGAVVLYFLGLGDRIV